MYWKRTVFRPRLFGHCIPVGSTTFLTYSLSVAIFVTITVLTVLFVLVKPRMFSTPRETGFSIITDYFGAILFASFLRKLPAPKENASLASGPASANIASQAIKLATLSTRILPLELVFWRAT